MSSLVSSFARFAGAGVLCIGLAGCGSINIPLGSLLGGETKTAAAAAKTDDVVTGSIAPATVVGKPTTQTVSTGDTTQAKVVTASASASDKPFSLDAPSDTTGSLPEDGKGFNKDDHDAVLAILSEALPEKGSANSMAWKNETTGFGGMVVPMAQLTEKNAACRDLLISYGKGNHKDWYRGEGCRTAGKMRLGDVQPWRKTR